MKSFVLIAFAVAVCAPAHAQTIDDGIMMSTRSLQAGAIYSHDSWNQYWEGPLKRVNGNIGAVTTESLTWTAAYGLTDRVTLVGSAPYVWTQPSAGVLQGQEGMQDLKIGGKFSVYEHASARYGALRAIGALSGSFPLTNYNPDFAPLSIGNHSHLLSGRATLNYLTSRGVYTYGTVAYTDRTSVTLDRPYFYTDGHLTFSSEVPMADVVDYAISVGYLKHDLNANVSFTEQNTRGGGDIRRQDMPFVSNRMNFSKLGGMAMYPVPKLRMILAYFSAAHTLSGRNVGLSTTVSFGLLYSHASRGRLIR